MDKKSEALERLKRLDFWPFRPIGAGEREEKEGGIRYAGFNNRLYASAIDTILLILIMTPLFPTMQINNLSPETTTLIRDLNEGNISSREFAEQFTIYLKESGIIENMFTNSMIQWVVMGVFMIMFWVYRSATPGKMLFKMKILDAKTLNKPKSWQLILRYLAYTISALPCFLGFFWIAFDKKKQGWHDKIARTVVIYDSKLSTKEAKERQFKIQTLIAIILFITLIVIYIVNKN